MLPEVSEEMKELFETNYPVAECTAAIGFFFVLTLEQIVTACCVRNVKNDFINYLKYYYKYFVPLRS